MKGGLHFFFPEEDLSKVFAKREVKPVKNKPVAVSQLSRQLEESRGKPNNPFLEYSKFEGEVRRDITFKVVIVTSIRVHILCVFIKKLFSWNRNLFFFFQAFQGTCTKKLKIFLTMLPEVFMINIII